MPANELHIPFVYAGEVYAAAIVLPLVSALAVALRFRLRLTQKVRLGPDDWAILAALVSSPQCERSLQREC